MSVNSLVEFLTQKGEDPARIHRRLGVEPDLALKPAQRLAVGNVFALWEDAARADAAVAVRVASAATLESSHLLGMLALTAPSVRAGIEAAVAFSALHTDGGRWRLSEDTHTVTLRWVRTGSLTHGHRLCNEAALCHFVNGLRRSFSGPVEVTRVWLRHEPRARRELSEFFGCSVEHDAADNGFTLRRDVLDAVAPQSNPTLWRLLVETAEVEIAKLRPASVAHRVRAELSSELERGESARLSSVSLARQLGMSERTLRRRLRDEQTTFRALLEEARRCRVDALFEDARQSITQIAFKAGYSEASAFTHAHHRWFGYPPRARRGGPLR